VGHPLGELLPKLGPAHGVADGLGQDLDPLQLGRGGKAPPGPGEEEDPHRVLSCKERVGEARPALGDVGAGGLPEAGVVLEVGAQHHLALQGEGRKTLLLQSGGSRNAPDETPGGLLGEARGVFLVEEEGARAGLGDPQGGVQGALHHLLQVLALAEGEGHLGEGLQGPFPLLGLGDVQAHAEDGGPSPKLHPGGGVVQPAHLSLLGEDAEGVAGGWGLPL